MHSSYNFPDFSQTSLVDGANLVHQLDATQRFLDDVVGKWFLVS